MSRFYDKAGVKTENAEQTKFVMDARINYPGLLIFAVANGGARLALEAVRLKGEGVLAGVPDIYVEEARGHWFGLRIEFKKTSEAKKPGGGLSEEQIKIHTRLTSANYLVCTAYGAAHGAQILALYMEWPQTRVQRA